MFHDRSNQYEFTNVVKELDTASTLFSDKVSEALNGSTLHAPFWWVNDSL